ncbi:hypothetical protein CA3LBN_001270 [Candidozyma haemuli]|uniref:Mitochondrial carrier protein n=1 Tax=Candidozyma haemuli TaxID=45357 RepID=A0ABX8I264_9ASCO|nr:hypothetical protein CA3LBN_001270 [[Candida] haemuloni]
MLAGGFGGAIGDSAMHSLDTVKTRQQGLSWNPRYKNMVPAYVTIFRQEGFFRGLYGGYTPAILGSFPSTATFFGTYEFSKRFMINNLHMNDTVSYFIAGILGDLASSVFYVPSEVLKTRLQLQGRFNNPYTKGCGYNYRNLRDAVRSISKTEGTSALAYGYKETLLRDLPFSALQFAFYERFRKWAIIYNDSNNDLSFTLELGTGAAAGGLAGVLTTPLDVIKTRIQTATTSTAGAHAPHVTSTGGAISQLLHKFSTVKALHSIYKNEGIYGMFSGVGPRLKISDGDTLKKRVQITFDSAGHFNHFVQKIKLWLGLNVVVQRSLEDQLSMSQDFTGSQSQRRPEQPRVEIGDTGNDVHSQRESFSQARPNSKDLEPQGSQPARASQTFPPSQVAPDIPSIRPSQSFSQNVDQPGPSSNNVNWQANSPQPSANMVSPSVAASNFTHSLNLLVNAAQGLQNEVTGMISPNPSQYHLPPTAEPTFALRGNKDGLTQHSQIFEPAVPPGMNRSISNVLSQPSQSSARPDDSFLSQSTQRFDNSCFSILNPVKSESQSADVSMSKPGIPSVTEKDLRNAIEDIPFEIPAEEHARKKTRRGNKMDNLLSKALEDAMKDEDGIEELDDMSLKLKIAQKLKSSSFRAFVKRVDKLVGDKMQQ